MARWTEQNKILFYILCTPYVWMKTKMKNKENGKKDGTKQNTFQYPLYTICMDEDENEK
jgi:hypothetical protein